MVQFMWSEKKNNTNIWQWPEPEETSVAGEKLPMKFEQIEDALEEEEGPLHKRWKSSSSSQTIDQQQWSLGSNEFAIPPSGYNPLDEPSPLGLRLRKSPSLLELIQMRLSQANSGEGALPGENLKVGKKRDVMAKAGASGSIDKLKASNFPALLLRIGQWEYVSKHEGDLVAKCYFAKHKLVWEVLNCGLKNKIEIQWADIIGLKANFPANGPGSLTIVLGRHPLFFKETNPQPRKHTLWQATTDFTNGEATTHRQHYLQCAEGVLNKHYEKLIQCDQRLNFLSQQLETVSNFPYFAAEAFIKDADVAGNNCPNEPQTSKGSSLSCIQDIASPSCSQLSSSTMEELGPLGLVHEDLCKEAHSAGSGAISTEKEYLFKERDDLQRPRNIEQPKASRLQPTMSISDLVNHIGHCISEQKSSGNPFFANVSGGDNPKAMLENIANVLLSDTQATTASDEKTLMARVNSLCNLLQDSNSAQADVNSHNRNDSANLTPENVKKQGNMPGNPKEDDSANLSGCKQKSTISRKDSLADLLHQLPRIASLSNFLFDISEDGEILNP